VRSWAGGEPDGTGLTVLTATSPPLLFNFFFLDCIVSCSRESFGDDSSHLLTRVAFTILVTSPPLLPPLQRPTCLSGFDTPARPSALCAHPTSLPIRKGGTEKIMNSFLESKMAFASDQSTSSRDFLCLVPILRLLFDNWKS